MTQEIKLYRYDGACSFAPHALLRHLAVPFHDVKMKEGPNGVVPADGSFTRAEYLQIHPSGYVPALTVDGHAVTEAPAVLAMIARLAPDREQGLRLLGETDLEQAEVIHWMAWLSGTLHSQGFAMYWRPERFVKDKTDYYPAVKQRGAEIIKASFERIEKRLLGKSYAVGDHLTLADFNLYFFWGWGKQQGFSMDENYPNWGKVLKRVEELEGVRKAMEVEGFSLYFS